MNKTGFAIVLLLLTFAFSCTGQTASMTVTAHRGGAFLGCENTVSCIMKGIATGVDAVEIDVHQSADGALIVCHDPTLDRTTATRGKIEAMTLAEIKAARIVDAEGQPTEETVPTLDHHFPRWHRPGLDCGRRW